MKIVVTGPQFPDSFARNISVTLEQMGHRVIDASISRAYHHQNRLASLFWRYLPLVVPSVEQAAYRKLVRCVARHQPDLVLLTQAVPPEVIDGLHRASAAKVVCWFTDAIVNFYRSYVVAGAYDALFLKEPAIVPVLREKLGLNAFYLPEACNPAWHRPVLIPDTEKSLYACDLASLGSLHYYRARMLEPFLAYDMKIWGNNCPAWLASPTRTRYQRVYVAEQAKAKAVCAAKIVLNTMHYTEIDGVNCTLFEVSGCGGFQIADWKPSLPELYEPESEIVTFKSRAELKDKVDYYLAHPGERAEIAARAARRAHQQHTYAHRLAELLALSCFSAGPKATAHHPPEFVAAGAATGREERTR